MATLKIRFKITLILSLVGFLLDAQSSQELFLRAKQNFNNQEFSSAVGGFAPLASDPVFGSYATFYLGLSYAESGNYNQAIDAWRQLLIKYPAFPQSQEVYFWLAKTYFDQSEFAKGVRQAQRLEDSELRRDLYQNYLGSHDFQQLRVLFEESPDDKELAALIVRKAAGAELKSRG